MSSQGHKIHKIATFLVLHVRQAASSRWRTPPSCPSPTRSRRLSRIIGLFKRQVPLLEPVMGAVRLWEPALHLQSATSQTPLTLVALDCNLRLVSLDYSRRESRLYNHLPWHRPEVSR